MKKNRIIIFAIIIIAILIRIRILLVTDNYDGVADRVVKALSILENPQLIDNFDGNCSVLYNYLLSGILYIWPNPLLAPRILSLCFGVLLIIPFYCLLKLLFNERVAIYSSLLLAIYPFHIIMSTLSTPDIMFYFFFFSYLYYLFKFKMEEKKMRWLIISALCFNIAAMLRFESWIFILLAIPLFFGSNKKYAFSFLLLSLISPSIWLFLCHVFHQDAFYSFTSAWQTTYAQIETSGTTLADIFGWLKMLKKSLGYPIVLLGMGGVLYSFIKRKFLHFSLYFVLIYSLYTFNLLMNRMLYQERYSLILGLLLLPYSILCLEKIAVSLKVNPGILFLAVFAISAPYLKGELNNEIGQHVLTDGLGEVARWVRENADGHSKIILGSDQRNVTHPEIILYSGLSPGLFYQVPTPLCFPRSVTESSVKQYIKDNKPEYFILNDTGFLQSLFRFDKDQKEIIKDDIRFRLVFVMDTFHGRFNIYEISYQ